MAIKRPPNRESRRIIRHPATAKRDAANSVTYLLNDYPRTLFPLSTTKVIAEKWGQQTLDYVYQQVLNPAETEHSFLSQARCYSSKQGFHLRRTVKLDPVAELFIYDLVYRNRLLFRKDFGSNRRCFGYRFENGEPLSPTKSYSAFKAAVTQARMKYPFMVKFDIAAYFNSIYHHDLVHWFGENGASPDDVEHLGQFLRETNGGRSVDCLPQGIHPCKLIGSEFLKFVDNSMRLRSDVLLRFMDDFYLFSREGEVINMDFVLIQQLLGDKGLSLNPAKTAYEEEYQDIPGEIDEMKVSLLKVRRTVIEVSGEPFEDEELEEENLSEEQVEYLLNLLKNPDIDEADAELVLVLLRDRGEDVLSRLEAFVRRFPGLSRNVYHFARYVGDKEALAEIVHRFAADGAYATEDQLFWMAKLSEEFLSKASRYRDILFSIYQHPNATDISKAKVLEIPEQSFGMPELRQEHLRVGKSDWLSWSSAVGSRTATKISRNHSLMYFGKASRMNKLISDCVISL
jgi:Reverse transcriptase (RNA-dependent DNA polymerase)